MAAAVQQQQQQQQAGKRSGWQRAVAKFGAYFEQQGLGPADIPVAIVYHEVVGLAMAAGFWSACYAVQPSKTVARPLVAAAARSRRGAQMQAAYNAALGQATATVGRLGWLSRAPGADPARLTVSLAESLCLRATIKPVTFPFKLWASYKLVLLGKQLGGGQGGMGGRKKKAGAANGQPEAGQRVGRRGSAAAAEGRR